ncbi:MAG: hypothetical protein PWP24_474, partial [Clostridiales bacterium]|nr:hypothetical protein [Clostridiales bacterium]
TEAQTKSEIKRQIKLCQEEETDLIIVSFHWGIEHTYQPEKKQQRIAHYAIDLGADLILGHHPHVLQGVESYKDKMIVYSLGNFCFGGNTNPSDKDTMIYRQTFVFENGSLSKASSRIIPCSLSSVSTRNNYQPTLLSGKKRARVIHLLNERSQTFQTKVLSSGAIEVE